MAKKIEVDVIINSQDSSKKLRELQIALKQIPAGTAEWKKVYQEIDGLKDRLEGAKKGGDDLVDTIASAPGPLGAFGRTINNAKVAFTSFNTALKASVIGLIVSAIGGLVAAFSQSEEATKKLQPLFIQLERILGGIFRAMEPLLDAFVEMVNYILPPLTKGIGIFYSTLFGLFTLIKEVGVGIGKTLKGIFTFDWDSITEGVSQAANGISKAVDQGNKAYERFNSGTKELTKTEKEQLAERDKNNEEARKKREEQEKKAEEERKKKEQEKLEAIKTAGELEKEAYLKLQSDRDRELYKAGEDYNNALIALEKAGITDKTLQQEAYRKTVAEINAKYDKQEEEERKKAEEKKKQDFLQSAQTRILEQRDNADAQLELYGTLLDELQNMESLKLEERVNLQKQYSDAILNIIDSQYQSQKQKIENSYGEFARFDGEYYEAQRKNLDVSGAKLKESFDKKQITEQEYNKRTAEYAKARKDIDKLEVKSNQEKVQLIGNAFGQLASIVGENTVAGKAFSIAKATIDTYQSAVSAYNALAGIPVIGPALAAIAAGAAIASGIATVKKIVAVQVPNAPGGAGSPLQSTPSGPEPGSAPGPISVNAQKKARGGYISRAQGGVIRGPGTETSDSIMALLSDGEFVVNSRATRLFQPLLSAINEFGLQPQFASGGIINTNQKQNQRPANDNIVEAISETLSTQPIRTYVTATDITNQQQFDRVIKSRSLI